MQIDPTMCMKTKDTMTKCPAKCRTFAAIEFHKSGHLRQLSSTDAENAVFGGPCEALLVHFSGLMAGRNASPRAFRSAGRSLGTLPIGTKMSMGSILCVPFP